MKKTYTFLLLSCAFIIKLNAQSDCSEAYAHIVYALSHSESSLDANNITHAKYYAERSREAFIKVRIALDDCDCKDAEDPVYDAIRYLSKADKSTTLEDAYYYANKGKKLADTTILRLDICTQGIELPETDAVTLIDEDDNEELASLESAQQQLLLQQNELKRKREVLQKELAAKQVEELRLQKEALIAKLESTVTRNVDTFNNALEACDCNTKVLNAGLEKDKLQSKSIEEIKDSVISLIKDLTSNYIIQLADCDREDDND